MLFTAEVQSTVGDQLARVALSVLVFDRTGSAAATALTYATTYLPAILGGFVAGSIGARLGRKPVMVGCEVLRALLFAAMAVPGLPLGVVIGLLAVAVFLGPAFSASSVSYLSSTLDAERFRMGTALRMISGQAAQVFGFAAGGVAVAALSPRPALLLDAATYLVSALLIGVGLKRHDVVAAVVGRRPSPISRRSVSRQLLGEPRLRGLLCLSALAGLFMVPESLAVPFGRTTGASTVQIGLLFSSLPLGGAIGAALLARLVPPQQRDRVAGWMAVGCGLPLTVVFFAPHWPVALVCWTVTGLLAAYQIEVFIALIRAFPDAARTHLIGVGSSVLLGAQGAGPLIFGWLAQEVSSVAAIAAAGLIGSATALALVCGPLRRDVVGTEHSGANDGPQVSMQPACS